MGGTEAILALTAMTAANTVQQHQLAKDQAEKENAQLFLQQQQAELQQQQNKIDAQQKLAQDISKRNNLNYALGIDGSSGSALKIMEDRQKQLKNNMNLIDINYGLNKRRLQLNQRRNPSKLATAAKLGQQAYDFLDNKHINFWTTK